MRSREWGQFGDEVWRLLKERKKLEGKEKEENEDGGRRGEAWKGKEMLLCYKTWFDLLGLGWEEDVGWLVF